MKTGATKVSGGVPITPSQRVTRTRSRSLGDLRLAAVFLVAFVNLIFVAVGPQLYPAELILALFTLAAIANRAKTPAGAGIIGLLLLWAVGTLLSDLNAGSEGLDAAKGILRVAFTVTNLVGLGWLIRDDPKAVKVFWYGMIAASISSFLFYPNAAAPGEPWKFGLGIPATLLVGLLASRPGVARSWQATVFIGMAGLHFVLGFRSLAVICGLTALVLICRYRPQREVAIGAKARMIFLAIAGALVGYVVTTTYDFLALQGTFGQGARIKAEYLSGQYGSLVSGRTELLYSVQSILSNPLFGVGSYGGPGRSATSQAVQVLENWGYTSIGGDLNDRRVTSFHSGLLGAVAENGLLAAPFWIAIAVVLVVTLLRVIRNDQLMAPLIAFLATLGIWDLLFSPYGADRRIWFAATVVSVLATRVPSVAGLRRQQTPRIAMVAGSARLAPRER